MPFIDKDFINDLSTRVDIVEIINKRVNLKKAGKDYKACCPFHNEKTPSFTVAPDKQIFHCFGCGESGSAIDFVMKHDHLDFVGAIETIANESGLQVVYEKSGDSNYSKTQEYFEIMKKVSDFYSLQIRSKKYQPIISAYAKKRGLSGDVAKRFEIGYSSPDWSALYDHFKNDEKSIEKLVEMGLLVKKEKQEGYYDRFRGRLMFPIHNFKGQVIAFGGRSIDEDNQPKYLNSPETPLFSKSKELYGLFHARKYSRSVEHIIVVEGYMDVVSLHQHGVTNAVASLGTATTPQHIDILSKTSNNIVFCFDGDSAGKNAAWKALNIALPKIKAGLIIKFMFLPDGEDPDSIIRKESKLAFEERVDNSITLSQFLFDHIKEAVNFETIEGKTQFLEKAFDLIKTIDYDVYAKQIIEGVANQVSQDVSKTEEMYQ
ncbi:MAG: DNA primase, partial [Gammaproteobacteria bacterium]